MEVEYPHPENDPRANAVYILDEEQRDTFDSTRAMGYALLAVVDRLTVINGTLCEILEAMAKR